MAVRQGVPPSAGLAAHDAAAGRMADPVRADGAVRCHLFLTDAGEPQLTASELEKLRQLNTGTVINAVEFGIGPDPGGDNFLVRLARQNGGQHVYIDVTRLPGR